MTGRNCSKAMSAAGPCSNELPVSDSDGEKVCGHCAAFRLLVVTCFIVRSEDALHCVRPRNGVANGELSFTNLDFSRWDTQLHYMSRLAEVIQL